MAARASLNAKNLAALGAERLAELLLLHTEGNAAARRALRLALAEQRGPLELAQAVRKRLAEVERSRSWLDQKRRDALLLDLDRQRQAIVGPIAGLDPDLALELLWRLLDLGQTLPDRCDGSDDAELVLFHQASADLGQVACRARQDPAALADQVATAVLENENGQYDHLIEHLKQALQPEGLLHLRQILESRRPPRRSAMDQAADAASGLGGEEEEANAEGEGSIPAAGFDGLDWFVEGDLDEVEDFDEDFNDDVEDDDEADFEAEDEDPDLAPHRSDRHQTVRLAMLAIADALGDAEAYLTEYRDHQPAALNHPLVAARIAQRFTAAGRAEEALALLDGVALPPEQPPPGPEPWIDARIAALDRLERNEEAQQLRWRLALIRLSSPHLRAYLKRLPAFEDGEAEERALDLVLQHPYAGPALAFLHHWPDRRRAARLILERPEELENADEALLAAVAEALETEQPLAATVCLRALIEATVANARSHRYRHAVRHLASCRRLAHAIADWRTIPDHNRYIRELLQAYGHRTGFLTKLDFDNLLLSGQAEELLEADWDL